MNYFEYENFRGLPEIVLLALTIYSEARGEPVEGQLAVAHVVFNRVERGGWWGDTIADVVLSPHQFSGFKKGGFLESWLGAIGLSGVMRREEYGDCELIAGLALEGLTKDPTEGATNFHAVWMEEPPDWALEMERLCQIGEHVFYK